jgi:4-amino-4-deoxy-L-arabinose transferase-like glycosyltransferase
MKNRPTSLPAFLVVVFIISAAYLSGLGAVPFHPDETTYIYTSADTEAFFSEPASQFWRPENASNLRQHYRLLDAPLVNYFIAAGRWVSGEKPVAADWDWAKTWQANTLAGALPSTRLLLASRAAVAILFPFSLVLLFLTVWRIANEFTAWTSALLLAGNALVLLHTRRAMAEGILLFLSILSLWCLLWMEKERWRIGIPAALAFCAKQLLAPLLPIGLAAVAWSAQAEPSGTRTRQLLRQVFLFGLSALLLLVIFHPFLWGQPLRAFQAAIQARQKLAAAQTADRPDQALNSPLRKVISMVSYLYLAPPQFAETGNYREQTRSMEEAYLKNPFQTLFSSIPAGAALLILSLFGFLMALLQAVKRRGAGQRRLILILAASLCQTMALYFFIPLPWQRYYLPLVPYSCLWIAFGIDQLRQGFSTALASRRASAS